MQEIGLCEGPAVWDGQGIRRNEELWLRRVDDRLSEELRSTTERVFETGIRAPNFGPNEFPLDSGASLFGVARNSLEEGAGFVLLRGLPTEGLSVEQLEVLLWGVGSHIGPAVRQTQDGTLIAHVRDRGSEGALARGHQTNKALAFHTDRCDVLALFCVRSAREGGLSALASAGWIHNRIASESPGALRELYSPMPHDLRGSVLYGDAPWAGIPVFNFVDDGVFVSRYIRKFTEGSQRFEDAPRLTEEQVAAMDIVDAMLAEPANMFMFAFEPGDMLLVNNYTVWHSRTRFLDWEEANKKRLPLRLWLSPENTRPLPQSFLPLYGTVEPGLVRGGFPA